MNAKPNIFEFLDYKPYLRQWISSRPAGGRGEKSRMAKKIQCQPAYITQVLNGSAHISIEQAEALNALLEHTEDEFDFFMLLVQRARAGTHTLARYFDRKIQQVHNQRLVLKNRLTHKKTLTREDQATYYGHWAYCAVHMAVLVPKLRTQQAIASHFGISLEITASILEFLESAGLVSKQGGLFHPGNVRIHLENDSPMISKHHMNWRLQAMRSLDRASAGELHYSSVAGISKSDVPRVRELLVRAIEDVRSVIKDSKDEAVYCYNLDLFELGEG